MKKNISLKEIATYISGLAIKYNLVIFIIIMSFGLTAVVLTVTNVLNIPYNYTGDSGVAGSSQGVQLDQATMTKLEQMETSDNNTHGQDIPSGRINPFSE